MQIKFDNTLIFEKIFKYKYMGGKDDKKETFGIE